VKTLLWAALVLALLAMWGASRQRTADAARVGVLEASLKVTGSRADSLRLELARQRGRVDTVLLTRWRPARAAVDSALRDTTRRDVPDSLVAPLLNAGDTTIAACTRTAPTCDALVATEKAHADTAKMLAEHWKAVAQGPRLIREAYAASDLDKHLYAGLRAEARMWGVGVFGRVESRIDTTLALEWRAGVLVRF
jgi:hypothetical protein